MKECIECGRILPEGKFRAYETKSAPITPAGAGYVRADTRLKEESRTDFMVGWSDTPMISW